jgi:hypothetical protein
MPQPIAKLTNNGNFLINGTYGFDEATFDPGSKYSKNLCAYSQSYVVTGDLSGWRVNYGTTIVKTNELAPDGTYTAARIRFGQPTYSSVGTPFCWLPNLTQIGSIWVRVDSGSRQFSIGLNGGGANAGFTATTTWTRFSTASYSKIVNYSDSLNINPNDGVGGGDVLIWGAQIEIGSVVTDYEPTGAGAFVYIPPGFTTRTDPTGFYTIGSLDEVSINKTTTQGTNLLAGSQSQFSNSTYWLQSTAYNIIDNSVVAPDGTLTGSTVWIEATANALPQYVNVIPATTYTFSFYAIRGTATNLTYSVFDNINATNISAGVSYYARLNSQTWTRVSLTFTTPATCTSIRVYPIRDNGVLGSFYLCGAQLELGAVATDYVPTGAGAIPIAQFVERKSNTGLHRIAGAYDEASLNPNSGYTKNYVSYSQTFNNAYWSSGGGVYSNVLANVTMAPDGTMTASKLVETANNNYHVLYQTPINNGVPGQVYCTSIYVKAAERYVFQMYAGGSSNWSTTPSGTFNLLTGTVVPGTFNLPAFITPVGNGWYRCSTQGICAYPPVGGLSLATNFGTCLPGTTTVIYQGDGNSGIYIWGSQMELSSLNAGPSTYVATGLNGTPLT